MLPPLRALTPQQKTTAAQHLAAAVRQPTLDGDDRKPFSAMHSVLRSAYPRAFAQLEVESIGQHALLLRWPGQDPALRPYVLMSHMDVVPAPNPEHWSHAPFSGDIADGFVWGRGTLDYKNGVIGMLEATELLLQEGFAPRRDVYLSVGDDEEIAGDAGGQRIAKTLQERNVRAALVLDEGGFVMSGSVPQVNAPVALVGVSEKGALTLRLHSETPAAGHASMPVLPGAIGRLSQAIARIESNPMPASLRAPTRGFLKALAPHMKAALHRVAVGHFFWAAGPIIFKQMDASPEGRAVLRTTAAVTQVRGGVKENVLPSEADAIVNLRIVPGDTVAGTRSRVAKLVKGLGVTVHDHNDQHWEPSPVSDTQGPHYGHLHKTIARGFPEAIVAPYLTMACTDSRHFCSISDNVYRFIPLRLHKTDVERIHGFDERVGVEDFAHAVAFYRTLIEDAPAV